MDFVFGVMKLNNKIIKNVWRLNQTEQRRKDKVMDSMQISDRVMYVNEKVYSTSNRYFSGYA